MDEQLSEYFNTQALSPPIITEEKIKRELEQRQKRRNIILLSLAGLLWTILLYGTSFMLGKEDQIIGMALLAMITLGHMCAGCFAGIVIKLRKVGI